MMKKIIIYIMMLLLCLSCKRHTSDSKKTFLTQCQLYEKYPDIFNKTGNGDTLAYEELKKIMTKESYFPGIITDALQMADTYHYRQAYMDVYLCLWHAFNDGDSNAKIYDMTRFDPESRKMAIYYLGEAAKRGNKEAEDILIKQYIR
jgi:hypothetical protein